MKRIVFLTGAGMSAESGIKTFRDANGLWEGHDVMEVASPDGWEKNRELVMDFYNQRRKQLKSVEPNDGHKIIAGLETEYRVEIITQNVDDLHERAGSSNVVHLHGELRKVRSSVNDSLVFDLLEDLHEGDKCPQGSQLRPHIVWFGEPVPMMDVAIDITSKADIFVVVGTSLEVYPAAGLIHFVAPGSKTIIIDPNRHSELNGDMIKVINEIASKGLKTMRSFI
jgi:NAD-dependent deacetylase